MSARVAPLRRSGDRWVGTLVMLVGLACLVGWAYIVMGALPDFAAELQLLREGELLQARYLGALDELPPLGPGGIVAAGVNTNSRASGSGAIGQFRQFRITDAKGVSRDLYYRDADDPFNAMLMRVGFIKELEIGDQVLVRAYPNHPESSRLTFVPAWSWVPLAYKVGYYAVFLLPVLYLIWIGVQEYQARGGQFPRFGWPAPGRTVMSSRASRTASRTASDGRPATGPARTRPLPPARRSR